MLKYEPGAEEDYGFKFWQRLQSMGFPSTGKYKSEDYQKIFSADKNRLWECLLKHIHPVSEVEHVMKNLAIKKHQHKLILHHQLKEKLCKKKEQIKLRESQYADTKQKLRTLECKVDQQKERVRELKKKILLLEYKKADLNQTLQCYKDSLAVAQSLQNPNESHTSNAVKAILLECEQDLAQFHNMMREKQSNQQALEDLKESICMQVRDIPITDSWVILFKQMECQTQELAAAPHDKDLLQDFQNIKSLKKAYSSAMDKFLIVFVNTNGEQIKLAQQLKLKKEVLSTLLNSTIQLIKDRFKFDTTSKGEAEIREWLTLKLKCERKKATVESFQEELNKLRSKSTRIEPINAKEATDVRNEIQTKVNNIRMTIPWLQDSLKQIDIAHGKLQKLMPEVTKLCTQEDGGLKTMERAIENMNLATKEEMDLFLALPLDKLVYSSEELKKQQPVHYNSLCSNSGLDIMTILDGTPKITTQRVVLRSLEKKLYRNILQKICLAQAASLVEIDKNELLKAEDDEAVLHHLGRTHYSFEMNSKKLLKLIEKNYEEWVQHPMQNALLHKTLEGKRFEEWMYEYDRALED